MATKVLKFVKSLDQFGVVFKPSIHYSTREYKTIIGGLASLLLYGLSFSYFLYMIAQWQNGSFLPKITITQTVIKQSIYQSQQQLISFRMMDQPSNTNTTENNIDPFNQSAIIIQAILFTFINGRLSEALPLQPNQLTIQVPSLNFQLNILDDDDKYPQIDFMIAFTQCNPKSLIPNSACASADQVDAFFSQKINSIEVSTYIEQFNTRREQVEGITKRHYVAIDNLTTYYSRTQLKLTTAYVDTGLLFESTQMYQYINGIETLSQQMGMSYFFNYFGQSMYMLFAIQVDSLETEQIIQYPKISEILAEIGSIISWLLVLSWIVITLNENKLSDECIRQVIEMYYPQFANIKFIKNWYLKIVQVKYKDQAVDLQQFTQYYDKLKQFASQKLTISNQIYEISRLQMILQSMQSRTLLKQSHKVGIQLQIFYRNDKSVLDNRKAKSQYSSVNNQTKNKSIIMSNQVVPVDEILPAESDQLSYIDKSQENIHQLHSQAENYIVNADPCQECLLIDDDFSLLLLEQPNNNQLEIDQTDLQDFFRMNLVEK